MAGFIEDTEYFTVSDVMSRFGLNSRGAEMYLDELVKNGKLVDVGLDKPKYTKSKLS
jgi:predicted HTH transcriptional regulator